MQQQQRQREISLLAYHGASSYPSSMLDLSFLASLKLPSYEEVAAQPTTPPPPYSSVFTTPRYPQPPRTSDPHLLTQHGPLLHRRPSDGPSSFSSDNSSSCSCDSCCPSSPCSSSISAPVTYETDTSHATTPSEATPLTLEVTMESIAAAVSCLNISGTPLDSGRTTTSVAINIGDEDAVKLQEPTVLGSWVPTKAVSDSPQPLASSCSESALPPTSSTEQLNLAAPCDVTPCSPSSVHSPLEVDTKVQSVHLTNTEDLAQSSKYTLDSETDILTRPSASAVGSPEALDLLRTFETNNTPSSPIPGPSTDDERTFVQMPNSVGSDPSPVLVLLPEPLSPTQAQAIAHSDSSTTSIVSKLTNASQALNPGQFTEVTVATPGMVQCPKPVVIATPPIPDLLDTNLQQPPKQGLLDLTLVSNPQPSIPDPTPSPAPVSPILTNRQSPELSPGTSTHPMSSMFQEQGGVPVFASSLDAANVSVPSPVKSQLSSSSGLVPPDLQRESGSCDQTGARSVAIPNTNSVPGSPTTAVFVTSCPSITIECEPPLSLKYSPSALSSSSLQSPSSPSSIPSPPTPCSISASALLLDPLTVPHQPSKGESSSFQATTLSPSPRATQSPPKQTLFSPCVDVFEPVPTTWEDDNEDEDEDGNGDDDDDMGADESQYRHRRLTGDSGIEVCRCQVEDEDDEEEEDGSSREMKEDGRKAEKNGSETPDFHDSVDCAARSQITTGDVTVCNPTQPQDLRRAVKP